MERSLAIGFGPDDGEKIGGEDRAERGRKESPIGLDEVGGRELHTVGPHRILPHVKRVGEAIGGYFPGLRHARCH